MTGGSSFSVSEGGQFAPLRCQTVRINRVQRSILTVPVERVANGSSAPVQDLLAVEEPLEIRVNQTTAAITMRTPGHDFDLAAGFLFTEGILPGRDAIARIRYTNPEGEARRRTNSITVELAPEANVDLARLTRHFYMSSSCGVCGKASLDALAAQGCELLPRDGVRFSASLIPELPARLRTAQSVFDRTGGLHAAALFDALGEPGTAHEDVGRHNAVDKVIGAELLAGRLPAREKLLLVSGRASFELVQKALMAGIPVLAAVGAPSSLAVETAQRYNMTLLGFVRDGRFNIYAGGWRIE